MSRELRARIQQSFRTHSDFDAFLIDYFPAFAKRIGSAVDLVERVNLFLKLLDQDQMAYAARLLNLDRHGQQRLFFDEDGRWDRIERACRQQLVRMHDGSANEKPLLRRRHAERLGPFLEARYQQGGRQIQYAVALAPATLNAQWLHLVHDVMAERGLLSGSVRPCEVLLLGAGPRDPERKLAKQLGLRLRSLDDFENLIDFRAHVQRQTEKLSRDKHYPPSLYVPQRMQVSEGASFRFDRTTDQALETVREWLQDLSRPHFVMLLGDFGVGKTFLLRELTRTLGQQGKPPWPLFLELRQLEKANALRPLLASYLAQPEHSETIPVTDVEALLTMLSLGRVVLFFDGFDELALRVSYQRATQHLETLLQSVASPGTLAKVVVTSRTQHFLSLGDLEKGVSAARKTVLADRLNSVAISIGRLLPFEETQIQTFLLHRLGSEEAAAARMDLIRDIKDLLGLSHNPRMLSFIAELPESDLRQAKEREGTITAAKLYELLVQRWLHFEVMRADEKVPEPGLTYEQRMAAVTTIAIHLWGQTERGVALDALGSAVQGFLHDHECAQHQLGSGTLLKSDDAGRFSFLHASVLEWFVARAAQPEVVEGRFDLLGRHDLSPLMAEFVWGLAGKEPAAAWSDRVLLALDEDLGDRAGVLKHNALTLLKRLDRTAPERQNLAGQDLRGRDFTGQSLAGADLSGTRLDEATLTGVSLRRADLRGASLRRAKLDRADLREADLRDADLSVASLVRADLRGVKWNGKTKLRRARLVGASLEQGVLDRLPAASLWGAGLAIECLTMDDTMGGGEALAWHPQEPICAVASGSVITLWDCELGIQVRVLRGHERSVSSVSFSPDGNTLASGSLDQTVRLWDVASGHERRVLRGHERSVNSVSFSPDDRTRVA